MEVEAAPPSPVQMLQMLGGFQISQALYVAAKLGVADRLVDGPRSVTDVASPSTKGGGATLGITWRHRELLTLIRRRVDPRMSK